MKFKHTRDARETWWVPVTIPSKELSSFLLSYDRSIYLEFEVHLRIEVTQSHDGCTYEYAREWSLPPVGNYPKRVIDAIDKYLSSIRVEERFASEIQRL